MKNTEFKECLFNYSKLFFNISATISFVFPGNISCLIINMKYFKYFLEAHYISSTSLPILDYGRFMDGQKQFN